MSADAGDEVVPHYCCCRGVYSTVFGGELTWSGRAVGGKCCASVGGSRAFLARAPRNCRFTDMPMHMIVHAVVSRIGKCIRYDESLKMSAGANGQESVACISLGLLAIYLPIRHISVKLGASSV